MKYCPDCEHKRQESEFGNNKNSRDGKQPYCLTHYKIRRKNYALTERGKKTEKARKLRFKKSGKQREYNQTYYRLHKDRILSSKCVGTISKNAPHSRTETFKDGNNKVCPEPVKRTKTIVLNPKPVKQAKQENANG